MKWFAGRQLDQEQTPQAAASGMAPNADHESWWYVFSRLSVLLLFVGLLTGLGLKMWQWLDRPVAEVRLYGDSQHLDRRQLAEQVAADLETSLLQVNIAEVQQLVRDQPWVHVAAIRRDWPDVLEVEIEEEVPVARWSEHGLLNHQGDIFWPLMPQQYLDLPRLSGPAPETTRVISQFHDLNQMFRPLGLKIVGLDLEARGAWSLVLDNQVRVIVGREDIKSRLMRFLSLYQLELEQRIEQIEQVDIRYTNGVAVKWRQLSQPEEDAG